MAANLIPLVRNFGVGVQTFGSNDCAVQEGCTSPGARKLLLFDFLCWNAGTTDVNMGAPGKNLQLYEFSPCHKHHHLKDFNTYRLYDCEGNRRAGAKQSFCLIDSEKIDPNAGPEKFVECEVNQGISAGWADLYNVGLDCQWIDITGLPDGDYTLEAWTNRLGMVKEKHYGDNLLWTGVRIQGNTAKEIEAPCYPEDCLGFDPEKVEVKNISGDWSVVDGNHWMLNFRSRRDEADLAVRIIKHYGMNRICFVGRPSKRGQLMMYFTIDGAVPTGPAPDEDALPFDPNNIEVENIGGKWKVVEGSHGLLDFGLSKPNANKAAWLIRHYQFTHICFVGRPNAPMMYFRQ